MAPIALGKMFLKGNSHTWLIVLPFYKGDNFYGFLFTTAHRYENTPIQIHWKFYNQKRKIFG